MDVLKGLLMKFKFLNAILAGVILCVSSAANAGLIIDNGHYTTDTVSGLDWLDITESTDTFPNTNVGSYDYISSQFGAGGEYEGWRYATIFELLGLINNATGSNISIGDSFNSINKVEA